MAGSAVPHLVRARREQSTPERGETLKDLVTRAVAHELRVPARPARAGHVSLPLVGRGASPSVSMTNPDTEAALEAEDIDRYAGR
jgi:hypothetical protein